MQKNRLKTIINPFDCPKIDVYKIWKSTRKELISTFENCLIELTEQELTTVFNEWSGSLNLRLQSGAKKAQMSCLLTISILLYFRKSYEELTVYFKRIQNLLEDPDIEVCKAAGKTLRWFAEDYADNQSFLQELLENADIWLSGGDKVNKLFNGFEVLYEVGRFHPSDVLNIFVRHMKVIFFSVSSENSELSKIATKTIVTHIKNIKLDIGASFSWTIYFDCVSPLKEGNKLSTGNFLLIVRTIFDGFPSVVNVGDTITYIINGLLHNDINTLRESISFLRSLYSSRKEYFTKEKGEQIIAALQTQLLKHNSDTDVFPLVIDVITTLSPDIIPLELLVGTLSSIINKKSLEFQHELAYDVLCQIVVIFPNVELQVSSFIGNEPSVGIIKIMRLFENDAKRMEPFLIDWFNRGLMPNATKKTIIVMLCVVYYFKKIIPLDDNEIFEEIEQFMKYPDKEIRCKVADAISALDCPKATNNLVKMAFYDQSMCVRRYALKLLDMSHICSHIELTPQILTDQSINIRNSCIDLLVAASSSSPSFALIPLVPIINKLISQIISPQSPSLRAKTCSTLPLIAKGFCSSIPAVIPGMLWCCVKLLRGKKDIPEFVPSFDPKLMSKDCKLKPLDLSKAIHYDPVTTITTDLWSMEHVKSTDTNLINVFDVVRRKWDEICDIHLLNTIGELAQHIPPYIQQIVPAFYDVFTTKHTHDLYMAAIHNLSRVVDAFQVHGSFGCLFPRIVPTLMNLMYQEMNKELSEAILRLVGTVGITSMDGFGVLNNIFSSRKYFVVKSNDFYMKYLIDSIVDLFYRPSPALLSAVVSIAARETKSAINILDKIMNLIVSSMLLFDNQVDVFKQLDAICYYCGSYVAPHLHIIRPVLLKSMNNSTCVNVCTTLSIKLKSDFTELAKELYPLALKNVSTKERILFKVTMKFISSIILNQEIAMDCFLDAIERRIEVYNPEQDTKYMPIIFKTFSRLAQYSKSSIQMIRITQIVITMKPTITKYLGELLVNLCLFGEINVAMVLHYINFDKAIADSLEKVEGMLRVRKWSIKDTKIVKDREPKLKEEDFRSQVPALQPPTIGILMNVKDPICKNSQKWIYDIALMVIQNSPNDTIRSCANVICHSKTIVHRLFPIVFIIYWTSATKEEKTHFSEIVKKMLKSSRIEDPGIFSLISALECVGDPIEIDNVTLSSATNSMPLSRYYLLCEKELNPNNDSITDSLVSLDVKMGLYDSARCFASQIKFRDPLLQARMYETLGDWDKALKIYESMNPRKVFNTIICHSMLEEWDDVIKDIDFYNSLSTKNKESLALNYAKAFYSKGEYKKASDYLACIPLDDTGNLLWMAKFYVATKRFNEARQSINRCFTLLAQDPIVFCGMNQSLAIKSLQIAHYLIELEEVMKMRPCDLHNRLSVWKNRLINMRESLDTWLDLFDVRSIALGYPYTVDICVRLLRSLKRECRWNELPNVQRRIANMRMHPKVILGYLKISIAKGEGDDTFNIVNNLLNIYDCSNDQDGARIVSDALAKFSFGECSAKAFSILKNDQSFRSCLYKIKGKIIISKEDSEDNLRSVIECCNKSFELENNSRAATELFVAYFKLFDKAKDEELVEKMLKSIFYVLKTSEKSSLAVLYLINFLRKYSEKNDISDDYINEINSLPYYTKKVICIQVYEIIATLSPKQQDFFRKIITSFSKQYFNDIIYFLILVHDLDEDLYKSIAEVIMKPEEEKMFNDTLCLVNCLDKCSINLCEKWVINLKNDWIPNVMTNTQEVLAQIRTEIINFKHSECNIDAVFALSVEEEIKALVSELNRYISEGSNRPSILLEALKTLLHCFVQKLRVVESLQISAICPETLTHDFSSVPIPSTFRSMEVVQCPTIAKIHPVIRVISTDCGMRLIHMTSSDGVKREFLLQAKDARIDRTLEKLGIVIQSRKRTFDDNKLTLYKSIIPLKKNLGVMFWPANSQTLHNAVSQFRKDKMINRNLEEKFIWQHTSMNYDSLSTIQKLEVYDVGKGIFSAHELRDAFWYKSISPQSWLESTRMFTTLYAYQSLCQYFIGIGERTLSNIITNLQTGLTVSFNYISIKNNTPSRVPFRLSRMIENALDGFSSSGIFRTNCIKIAQYAADNRKHIFDIIDQFECYFTALIGKELTSDMIRKAKNKVATCADKEDISNEIDQLIKEAKDPARFTRFPYSWEPFW